MNISSDDIIFRRAVIQLLDVENGNFEAARELLFLKNDIMELLRKQLVYIMQADEVKQAKWNNDSKVMNRIEQMYLLRQTNTSISIWSVMICYRNIRSISLRRMKKETSCRVQHLH